uniref:Uncharacterized protein n=1 Tax=Oryza glumipatula TaxID=40148 RepID=A0A0E0A6Y3_9ORYZ
MANLDFTEAPWDESDAFHLYKCPSWEIDWDSILSLTRLKCKKKTKMEGKKYRERQEEAELTASEEAGWRWRRRRDRVLELPTGNRHGVPSLLHEREKGSKAPHRGSSAAVISCRCHQVREASDGAGVGETRGEDAAISKDWLPHDSQLPYFHFLTRRRPICDFVSSHIDTGSEATVAAALGFLGRLLSASIA